MYAKRVKHAEQLPGAIERALANRLALLDVLVTTDAVSSDANSGLAWVPDLQPLASWDEAGTRLAAQLNPSALDDHDCRGRGRWAIRVDYDEMGCTTRSLAPFVCGK
jgi:hypothetical protein